MLEETEAQTKAMSRSRVNTSPPAVQLSAPPWGSPRWKRVGWTQHQKSVGDTANCGSTTSSMRILWPFGAGWNGGSRAPWESGEGLAPLSVGVSAPGVVPKGQRRGNALFQ